MYSTKKNLKQSPTEMPQSWKILSDKAMKKKR